jgi:hypothetical protein
MIVISFRILDEEVFSLDGREHLFTIVLHFTGQQASGVQALINLQCRALSLELPMLILEPVMTRNKFKAMPHIPFNESDGSDVIPPPEDALLFDDLFNLANFNKISRDLNYSQLAPRDIFFEKAPRKIVLVFIYEGERNELPELTRLWPKRSASPGACFDPLTSQLNSDPKYQLYQIVQKGFCIVKVILFRMTRGEALIFTEGQLRTNILGRMKTTEFTLVFNIWMPKFVLPGIKGRECIDSGYHSSKGQFQPSRRLLANAKYYKKHFMNSTDGHISLMIRLEQVYMYLHRPRSAYGNWTVKKCLDMAIQKVKEYQSNRSLGLPFVTLDVGKYGSKTLKSAVELDKLKNDTKYINRLLSSVYDHRWNLKEWENSFTHTTGGIVDSSYIAALQRTLASRAKCLVLVGGGMFQELTMRKYMELHNKEDWCIEFLCVKDRIDTEV